MIIDRRGLTALLTIAASILLVKMIETVEKGIEARRFDRFRAAFNRPSVTPDPEETIDA